MTARKSKSGPGSVPGEPRGKVAPEGIDRLDRDLRLEWKGAVAEVVALLRRARRWEDALRDLEPESRERAPYLAQMKEGVGNLASIRIRLGYSSPRDWDRVLRRDPELAAAVDRLMAVVEAAWQSVPTSNAGWTWVGELELANEALRALIEPQEDLQDRVPARRQSPGPRSGGKGDQLYRFLVEYLKQAIELRRQGEDPPPLGSQKELAVRYGISQATVSRVCKQLGMSPRKMSRHTPLSGWKSRRSGHMDAVALEEAEDLDA